LKSPNLRTSKVFRAPPPSSRIFRKTATKSASTISTPPPPAQQYLEAIKADFIKIDGRYIRRINASAREAALVRNLVKMCQDNGTEVIAEGVEEKAQADLLAEMGVKYAQGNLYAPAGPKTDYVAK
jgi:c-di-GMP-related signal transduction protein